MRSATSLTYKVGLVLVAVTMVILPLLYLGLAAAVWWGVYEFAVEDVPSILGWPGPVILRLFCAFTPLIAGGLVGLFMVKPLFAPRGAAMQPLAVTPENHPTIFHVTETVASWVGSPIPHRIEVDCSINASARLERGWQGFVKGRLILTLGMPLAACLTQRELAGVIAHELGHFRQGAGLRLTYLIRRINHWFGRVVYERDGWDDALVQAQDSGSGWINLAVILASFAVWLSRQILWLLMMTGHGVSALLLRQMEYDADAAEARVAGSDAFESTTIKLMEFLQVNGWVHRELSKSWRKTHTMPDNLPLIVQRTHASLTAEQRDAIVREASAHRTGWFDTHPSHADRVQQARRLGEPGVGFADEPATAFFEHFPSLAHLATLTYYEDVLNVPTSEGFLTPVAPQEA